MSTVAFNATFVRPQSPSEGAWCLAIALVGQADLNQAELCYELLVGEVFAQAGDIPYAWLDEAIGRAAQFGLITFAEEAAEERKEDRDFDSMPLFITTGYRRNPNRMLAALHPSARASIQVLQVGIRHLHQQGKLTPASLTKYLKKVNPLAKYDLKKNSRYQRATTWHVQNERPVGSHS